MSNVRRPMSKVFVAIQTLDFGLWSLDLGGYSPFEPMRYREIKPQSELRRFVECFWTLESDHSASTVAPAPILPDGCVELILNCGSPFQEIKENGKRIRQPAHFVVGQMTRPVLIAPTGAVELIGIRFHPGGTIPFLAQPQHELTNQIIELSAIDSAFESELVRALAGSRG